MHLKRQEVPKNWPIFRKGTKYIVKPKFNTQKGVPILIVLRDMLKVAQNKKEVKRAIHLKDVLVNNKFISDEKKSVMLFDTISLLPMKKHYRIEISENRKFYLNEIKESEANQKIAKLSNKKMLRGKKIQLNCDDGRNFISNIKCNVNDSLIVNFKEKKIEKCVPFVENAGVFVFSGKHAGKSGIVKKVHEGKPFCEVEIDGKPVNVLIKQFIVVK